MTLIDKQIATVDAVSSQKIRCTLALPSRGTPVRGSYVVINTDETETLLGRITRVDLSNQVHDNPTFKAWIMANGPVKYWSAEVDIEDADIELIRALDRATGAFIPMRRNPPTGTPIVAAAADVFDLFLNEKEYMLCIGEIPNSDGLRATIVNRSFGAVVNPDGSDTGGYGEARHVGIFGQNGSGKTVFATMLLAGKLSAHPGMGLLMPDTAGDLADADKHDRGDFKWNYADVLQAVSVAVEVIDISDIRLSSPPLLKDLLAGLLANNLGGIASEKARQLADRVVDSLFETQVNARELTAQAVLDAVVVSIEGVYAKASKSEKRADAEGLRDIDYRRRRFDREFARVRDFFDGREPMSELIKGVLSNGRKVVIRMSGLSEKDQEHIMVELMGDLVGHARRMFMGTDRPVNAVVVLDEANRWAPEGESGGIADVVKRNFRETRKYGLGWWFIAQRPATISKSVLSEAHTVWFGRNLGIGADRKHLDEKLGKAGVEEYDRLSMQGGYFWIGVGQDNNIGTEGTYFSVHPFGGNATEAFIAANPQVFGQVMVSGNSQYGR
jgi:DNA helicase HerA-like ATPase